MRRAVLAVAVAACGGSTRAPEPEKPVEEPPRPARVVVEDDSEPEDGVEIISTRGRMDPSAIEAGIAPHAASLSACYMSQVGRRRWLGGRVTIHWAIKRTGEIGRVVLSESNLGAWPIEKCLLEVARAVTFGKPIGGAADFSIPLEFSAKGQSTTWDDDLALRAVGSQLASLDDCVYGLPDEPAEAGEAAEAANGNGTSAAGRKGKGRRKPRKDRVKPRPKPRPKPRIKPPDDVTITVYVGPLGKAQSVGFSSATSVLDDEWAACAEKTALAWRLPDPRGEVAKLAIRYRAR